MTEEVIINNKSRRCCSLCKKTGHNISTCNDIRLTVFEDKCITFLTNTDLRDFEAWIYNILLESDNMKNVIRGYAIIHCNCSAKSHFNEWAHQIKLHINNLVIEEKEQKPHRNNRRRLLGDLRNLKNMKYTDFDRYSNLFLFINFMGEVCDALLQTKKFKIETSISTNLHTNQCECNICYELYNKQQSIILNCGHEFCKDCIKKTLQNEKKNTPNCALCRAEIKHMEFSNEAAKNEFNELIS